MARRSLWRERARHWPWVCVALTGLSAAILAQASCQLILGDLEGGGGASAAASGGAAGGGGAAAGTGGIDAGGTACRGGSGGLGGCGGGTASHVWSDDFGDSDEEQTWGLGVDAAGNVAIGGFWQPEGTPGLDLGCGELAYESQNSQLDVYLSKLAATDGGCLWSRSIKGTLSGSRQQLWNVAVDSAGNVIAVGEFTGNIDLNQDGVAETSAAGIVDTFVARYASMTGTLQWWRTFGSDNAEVAAYGAAVDAEDNPLVVGRFHGNSVDFGADTWIAPEASDGFVVRLAAADGATLHAAGFGGAGNQIGTYVAADSTGRVVVTGQDQDGAGDFGDILVARLNPDLKTPSWAKVFGPDDGHSQWVVDVDIMSVDDIIVAGQFADSLSLGATELSADGDTAAFAARLFVTDGSERWAKSWGDSGDGAAVTAVAVDDCDRIVLGGWFYGQLELGGSTDIIDAGGNGSAQDAFLAELDAAGTGIWARGFGDDEIGASTGQAVERVVTNADGTIALAGRFFGIIDLGGGPIDCATCTIHDQADEFVGSFAR